jgi:hypothetical protein
LESENKKPLVALQRLAAQHRDQTDFSRSLLFLRQAPDNFYRAFGGRI